MKDNKKMTSLIFVLVLTITLIASGTFAYWQWITSTEQQTLVNVSLTDDATILIDFPSNELTNMYPTSDCEANGTSSWVTDITVNNGTGVKLATNFKLKIKIEDKDGNVITNGTNEWNDEPLKYYVKYAVTEVNESCKNALIKGRFSDNTKTYQNVGSTDPHYDERNDWYDSPVITKKGADGFPIVSSRIDSGVSFHAYPNTSTKHTYKVWVWLDEEYKSVTVGEDSTMDSLQDAKITVSWSENSELEQIRESATPVGEAVAIYSADDNSLRFYRDEDPESITVGSTYNGRKVTKIFTGVETTTYEYNTVPWQSNFFDLGNMMPDGNVCSLDNSTYASDIGQCYYEGASASIVVFEDYIYPISTSNWFYLYPLISVDVTKLDTANVTDMGGMFGYTSVGRIIGIENWDTSNVTNMGGMFGYTDIQQKIDLSHWNVCNVENYNNFSDYFVGTIVEPYFGNPRKCNGGNPNSSYNPEKAIAIYSEDDQSLRFYREENPSSVTVGSTYNGRTVTAVYTGFETTSYEYSNIPWANFRRSIGEVVFEDYIYPVSTANWFSSMENLYSADLLKLDTSNVTNMSNMFATCSGITYLNLSHFDTSNVTNMEGMFFKNWKLSSLDIEGWDTSNVTNMSDMFYDVAVFSLDLSGWNVCNVTEYDGFTIAGTIVEPNWGMACPYEVGEAIAIYSADDSSLTFARPSVLVEQGGVYNNKTVTKIFTGIETDVYTYDDVPWKNYSRTSDSSGIAKIIFVDKITPISTAHWFGMYLAPSIEGFNLLDTSNVRNMKGMFRDWGVKASGGITINVSGWNTSRVENMSSMFQEVADYALHVVGLSSWNTSKVTDMSLMFYNFNLEDNDISSWNTSNVRDMHSMFFKARSNSLVDLSSWNVCNVEYYQNFLDDFTGTMIEPNWGMTC